MQVHEIMSSPAITVAPDASIQEVARLMWTHRSSGVPVVDKSDALLGVITELDMIARNAPIQMPQYFAILSGLIPVTPQANRQYRQQVRQVLATNAEQLMHKARVTVAPETELDELLRLMQEPEIFSLPVLAGNAVVGVVTRTDVVRLIERLEGEE